MSEASETPTVPCDDHPAGTGCRVLAALLAIGLTTLLVTAGTLEPSRNGLGTHQQLGLPPCTSIAMFGIPCPSCGMTTSWSHFVRGQWVSSIQANPGGFMLALLAVSTVVQSARLTITAQQTSLLQLRLLAASLIVILLVTLVNWFFVLSR